MGRRSRVSESLDVELEDLPPALRWREWMGRVEAVIFASPTPVARETLARVVGKRCNLDAVLDDIRAELGDRPYELVAVAGGWQHRTRARHADALRAASGLDDRVAKLSRLEMMVLAAVAYDQPITRREIGDAFGREISRDTLADLRALGLIANGPRCPGAGAPTTYVTTAGFLSRFGLNSLKELPDRKTIESERFASTGDADIDAVDEEFGRRDEYDESFSVFEEEEF